MGIQTLNEDQCKLYGDVHQVAVLARLADDPADRLIIINGGGTEGCEVESSMR
jgi:hypothetical protein